MNKQAVIECVAVEKHYQDAAEHVSVLKGIDFTVEQGETLAIVGSSGSGKSTLLHILGTLDMASKGQVKLVGQDISTLNAKQLAAFRNQHLGFIYQFHHLLMDFSAEENVAMPLLIRGEAKVHALEKARAMLAEVGLSHRTGHKPSMLSGGERQRVAIARALIGEPSLVLADEPTGNLDRDNALLIYQLMGKLNQRFGTSFVVVTHDNELASKFGRVLQIKHGKMEHAQ